MSQISSWWQQTAGKRDARVSLVVDADHYVRVVLGAIANAQVSLWIATANIKGVLIEAPVGTRARASGRYVSILELLCSLDQRGVQTRLLHGSAPSRMFAHELKRLSPRLSRLQLRQCPRVHLKLIVVDGELLYLGSANLTGAGLGAKGERRRNFEMGILTDDDVTMDAAQERFEKIWSGNECTSCGHRNVCDRPIDQLRPRH